MELSNEREAYIETLHVYKDLAPYNWTQPQDTYKHSNLTLAWFVSASCVDIVHACTRVISICMCIYVVARCPAGSNPAQAELNFLTTKRNLQLCSACFVHLWKSYVM